MISRNSIDQVLETAQTEEVVGNYVNLKRRGVNLIGLCPFHDEKTPSFTVSPAKNIYKCFGCGQGGGAVNFIMDHEGYSFPEAIRYLAKMYNIDLEETVPSPEEEAKSLKKDSLFIVNEFSKNHFIHNLHNTQAGVNIGLSYFKERGFREKTIKDFELGFAPDEYANLTENALHKSYNKEFLLELGLSTQNGRDFFRNRVIFPIHNLSGKAIGFGGRALTNDKKTPKYLNSAESEIYNKRKSLYALYFAKTAIRKEDSCILVEGYTDVISLHQAGIQNVVASSGTALTDDQIKLIKRYTQNVVVIFDGDPAGINAALRGMDLILAQNMYVKIVILPENHDPDSFLRASGPAAFLGFLEQNSNDFILFKSKLLGDKAKNDPVAKVRVLKDIVQTISKVPDPLARSTYIKECSTILQIDESVLISETNKLIKNEIKQRRFREGLEEGRQNDLSVVVEPEQQKKASSQKEQFTGDTDQHLEKQLLHLMINYGDKLYDETNETYVVDFLLEKTAEFIPYFESEFYTRLIIEILDQRKKKVTVDLKFFMNHSDESFRKFAIDESTSMYNYANWSEKGMELQTQNMPDLNYKSESDQLTVWFHYRKLDKIISENLKRLKEIDPSSEDYIITLKIHQRLLEEKKELATVLNIVIS